MFCWLVRLCHSKGQFVVSDGTASSADLFNGGFRLRSNRAMDFPISNDTLALPELVLADISAYRRNCLSTAL